MIGSDRSTGRVVALIALVLLVGIGLRGYLPPDSRSPDKEPSNSPAAMVAVIILLAAAVVIITIAIIATLREPRTRRPTGRQLSDAPGGDRQRPSWRLAMIALAVLLGWLLAVVLLMRLSGRLEISQPPMVTPSSTPTLGATPTAPPPAPPRQATEGDLFWYLFATTVFMLVLFAAGIVVALRRQRRGPSVRYIREDSADPPEPAAQPLALAAERGLAEIGDLSREPREAIIACYAAMENALATAPGAVPQDSDTPSEVLARAVESHAILPGVATDLVELFAEARFSPHVMNEEHRETAVRALQLVLAELRTVA